MDATYNDIQPWRFTELVKAFGAKDRQAKTFQIKTKAEVHDLFTDEEFSAAECLQFVELFIPKEDAPRALKLTAEASAKNNAKQ
jgi:pyruvate decarboxylase